MQIRDSLITDTLKSLRLAKVTISLVDEKKYGDTLAKIDDTIRQLSSAQQGRRVGP